MVCFLANHYFSDPLISSYTYASIVEKENARSPKPASEEILASIHENGKVHLTKQEKRILKPEFRKQLKLYAKAKLRGDKSSGEKALLIILTIIAALRLLYLLAALACSISCGGADALAVIVAVLDTAGIVLLSQYDFCS